MTDIFPITPPPEMVEKWLDKPEFTDGLQMFEVVTITTTKLQNIATQAAQWGADQELEACCEVLARELICDGKHVATDLRTVRRPKPLSLNKVALQMLGTIERDAHYLPEITDTIRRALKALDD